LQEPKDVQLIVPLFTAGAAAKEGRENAAGWPPNRAPPKGAAKLTPALAPKIAAPRTSEVVSRVLPSMISSKV
jgi:hypothetical protein